MTINITTVCLIVCSVAIGQLNAQQAPERRTIFNDDAQVLMEAPIENTSTFVRAWLDREAAFVPFTTFVFLAATPDICTYNSKAGEPYGARFVAGYEKGWARGMRGLRAEGTDALRLVTDHMKTKGFEVMAAVRMNDTHHRSLDPRNPGCSLFTILHPEYIIKQPDGRLNETALDYSYEYVRSHRLDIMREIAEQYNVDGLELNFVRWAKHFPRDKGKQKAPIMTDFIHQIRDMLDMAATKRGVKRLILGVCVPESVHTCWLAGVDIKQWVEEGWIDYVVAATWNNTDPQLPVEQFSAFTHPAGVQLLVLMGNMIGAVWPGPPVILDRGAAMSAKHAPGYQGLLITEAEARAAAANYYAWGADGISLWNVGIHFGDAVTAAPEQRERIKRWTHAVCDPKKVYEGPRRYHYLPMGKGMIARKPPLRNYPWYDEGYSPLGQRNSPVLEFAPGTVGERLVFPFRMADGRNGESLRGKLEFPVYHLANANLIRIDINGHTIPSIQYKTCAVDPRTQLTGIRFSIRLSDCPPFRGDNELGLTLLSDIKSVPTPYMEELDIFLQ
jgi:hypothetical protein